MAWKPVRSEFATQRGRNGYGPLLAGLTSYEKALALKKARQERALQARLQAVLEGKAVKPPHGR